MAGVEGGGGGSSGSSIYSKQQESIHYNIPFTHSFRLFCIDYNIV